MAGKNGKVQFYVFYLGWKECKGLWGREFVEPIVRELIFRRNEEDLPKLTIECTKKELKITQLIQKKKKVEKLKYPNIPTKDVTYAVQALAPDEDVVACIYLGYNPQTRAAVHVHVYRCDSPHTAAYFVDYLTQYINLPENKQRAMKIEQELISKGQVFPRPSAMVGVAPSEAPSTRGGFEDLDDPYDNANYYQRRGPPMQRNEPLYNPGPYSREAHEQRMYEERRVYDRDPLYGRGPYNNERDYRNNHSPSLAQERPQIYEPINPSHHRMEPQRPNPHAPRGQGLGMDSEREEIYSSMTEELKAKLRGRAATGPALLPPKDYDTIHRHFGNLVNIEERRCTNPGLIEQQNSSSEPGGRRLDQLHSYNDPYGSRNVAREREDPYQRGPRLPGPISRAARSPDTRGGAWNGRREPSPEGPRYSGSRGRSPTRSDNPYMARAMSPPPGHELRNSYFPPNNPLPNYLKPNGNNGYPNTRAVSPGRGRFRNSPSPNRQRYGSEDDARYGGAPKYTASKLGLVQGAPQQSMKMPAGGEAGPGLRPRSDEGYLSLERNSLENQYENARRRELPFNTRDRDESPPPREVIAGERAHPELEDARQDLPGSGQPFLY